MLDPDAARRRIARLREWAIELYQQAREDRRVLDLRERAGTPTVLYDLDLFWGEWPIVERVVARKRLVRGTRAAVIAKLKKSAFGLPHASELFAEDGLETFKRHFEVVELLRLALLEYIDSPGYEAEEAKGRLITSERN